MAVSIYGGVKCEKILNLDDSLSSFLIVLKILNNKFLNSIFKYKLEYKFEYKLEGFNTLELVPDITDYKLEYMTQKFKF